MPPIMNRDHTTWWIIGAAGLTVWSAIASPGILTVAAGLATATAAAISLYASTRARR